MSIRIERWSTTLLGDSFKAPEQRSLCIHGEVHGHPNFADGTFVVTSAVVKTMGRTVRVEEGYEIVLGGEDPAWIGWMESQGIRFDPENPIKSRRA